MAHQMYQKVFTHHRKAIILHHVAVLAFPLVVILQSFIVICLHWCDDAFWHVVRTQTYAIGSYKACADIAHVPALQRKCVSSKNF